MTSPVVIHGAASVTTMTRTSMVVGIQMLAAAGGAFVLNAMAAAEFGAGAELDAYYFGAAIPTAIVSALTAGLVFIIAPLVRDSAQQSTANRRAMVTGSLAVVGCASLLIATVLSTFASRIVDAIGSNLDPSAQSAAVSVLAIQAWTPLFVATSAWGSAHLVAHGRPALASGGPAAGSCIAILVFAISKDAGGVTALAWAVLCGTAAQLLFALAALRVSRLPLRVSATTGVAMGRSFALVLPWFGAAILYKSQLVIDRLVGLRDGAGAASSLALGLTVVTVMASALTRGLGLALSPRLGGSDSDRDSVWTGVRAGLLLLAPVVCVLVALRGEFVTLLLGRGEFSGADVATTAATLVPYAVVLVALGLGNVITTTFYALGDTRTPAAVGVAGLILYVAVTFALWPWLGYLAAAWGYAAMTSGSLVLLIVLLQRRMGRIADFFQLAGALRPVALAIVFAPILVGGSVAMESWLEGGDSATAVRVAVPVGLYLLAYFGVVLATPIGRPARAARC